MPDRETLAMNDLVIRPARRSEIATVLALWSAADAVPSVTDDGAGLERLLDHDPDSLLVAVMDDTIVGSVVAAWDGWRGNFYRLVVAPEFRHRGIARALVEAGEGHLRRRGARRVTALVVRAHDEAVGFWRAAGFEHDHRISRYVVSLVSFGSTAPGPSPRE
jgi:ribosomal protein S18 acetylase RimI-like enzyme